MSRLLGTRNDRGSGSVMTEIERAMKSRHDIDPDLIEVVLSVPREEFVAARDRRQAKEDRALSIGRGQTISQPSLVAHMISELRLTEQAERVLDVGCGSGYQAAILSKLANKVFSVERIADLAKTARSRLTHLGFENVEVVMASEDVLGHPDEAPYDAIIVGASVPEVPPSLVAQLKLGARMVIPVGPSGRQRVATVMRQQDDFEVRYGIACVFVPLIGPEAW